MGEPILYILQLTSSVSILDYWYSITGACLHLDSCEKSTSIICGSSSKIGT